MDLLNSSILLWIIAFSQKTVQSELVWFPYNIDGDEGVKEYAVSNTVADFFGAQIACRKQEARLAVFSNLHAFQFIRVQLNQPEEIKNSSSFYVGANRINNSLTNIKWSNGKMIQGFWGPHEPTAGYNCVVIRFLRESDNPRFALYTERCSQRKFNFICERQAGSYWTQWSSWPECSSSCGRGERERRRKCSMTSPTGPMFCSTPRDVTTEVCNAHLCSSVFLHKTTCNASCGQDGSFEQYFGCEVNETLPDECSQKVFIQCAGSSCPSTASPEQQDFTSSPATALKDTTLKNISKVSSFPFVPVIGGSFAGVVTIVVFSILIVCRKRSRKIRDSSSPRGSPANDVATTVDQQQGYNRNEENKVVKSFDQVSPNANGDTHYEESAPADEHDYTNAKYESDLNNGPTKIANKPYSYSIVRETKKTNQPGTSSDSVYNVLNTDASPNHNVNYSLETHQTSLPGKINNYDYIDLEQYSRVQDSCLRKDLNNDYNVLQLEPGIKKSKSLEGEYDIIDTRLLPNDLVNGYGQNSVQINESSSANNSSTEGAYEYDSFTQR